MTGILDPTRTFTAAASSGSGLFDMSELIEVLVVGAVVLAVLAAGAVLGGYLLWKRKRGD